jgi:preprotein translocase subunit YajC
MKVFGPSNDFLKRLATSVEKNKKSTPKVYIAEEKNSSVDDAIDHAKAYWMMGWNWYEIGAILEDMEFTDDVIKKAIKKTKEYAKETLKNGPFSTMKEGQLIRLKNGMVGSVKDVYEKFVNILLDNEEVVKVQSDQIDFRSVKSLKEAFRFRESAKRLYKEAQTDALVPIGPSELQQPRQEEQFELRTTPTLKTPKEFGEFLPEKFVDVEKANTIVEAHINTILGLEEELKEAKEELLIARSLATEQNDRVKQILQKKSESGKLLASVLGVESDASDKLETVLFKRFKDLLVGYRQVIAQSVIPPGLVDEHNKLLELIQEKAPEVIEDITQALDVWKEASTGIVETLKTEVSVSKPPKKMLSQDWVSKFTDWLSNAWKSVKGWASSLYTKTFPKIEEMNTALESFLMKVNAENTTAKLKNAINPYVTK